MEGASDVRGEVCGFSQKTRAKKWQGGHFLGACGVPPFGSIPLVALRTPAGTGFRPPLQCLPCIALEKSLHGFFQGSEIPFGNLRAAKPPSVAPYWSARKWKNPSMDFSGGRRFPSEISALLSRPPWLCTGHQESGKKNSSAVDGAHFWH